MDDFINEYNKMKNDPVRTHVFTTTGGEGLRIFPVLNSNMKSLETIGKYIDELYSVTTYSETHKQKFKRIENFNFRSLDNHSDQRAITRSDIVMKAKNKFGGYNHAFVALLIYILLLNVDDDNRSEIAIRASSFVDELPKFIKRKLYYYAKTIASNTALLEDNLYQEIVIYYGDSDVYHEFLKYLNDFYPDEHSICSLFETEMQDVSSPIYVRIHNFQMSAIKKEALYSVVFYTLDQFIKKCKMKGLRTGTKVIDAKIFLMEYFDYLDNVFENSYEWLGRYNAAESIDSLKEFISNSLSENERNEILRCLSNAFNLQIPEEE